MYYIYIETRPNLRVICNIKKNKKQLKKQNTTGDTANHQIGLLYLNKNKKIKIYGKKRSKI